MHRLKGYRQALREYKVEFSQKLIAGDGFTIDSGYRATQELLEQNRPFTAILSLTCLIALGSLRALAEAGLKVPEDLSIVTFDTIEGVEFFKSPLTTVYQPARELGARAAALLFDRIHDCEEPSDQHVFLPTKLTPRQSVMRISCAD